MFALLASILAAHGATFADVVSIRTAVTDIGLFPDYGAVRSRLVTATPPTSTTVQIAGLRSAGADHHRPSELGPLEISVTPHPRVRPDRAAVDAFGVTRLVVIPPAAGRADVDELIHFVSDVGVRLA